MSKVTHAQLAALAWCVALLLCVVRFMPPKLAADDSEHFAGQHAYQTLGKILPDATPHPLGSPAQVEMRGRVEAEHGELGLEPMTSAAWSCSPLGQCGLVHNIVVEIPGAAESDDAIAFVAHTDSALAGPGAADDGQGVAILLELARHITRGTVTPKNTVVLLFTDGEEEGLLGALSFIQRDPLAARVAVAVNIEARGQRGISMLFQTLGEDAWLIDAYAEHARAPYCTTVSQAVYEMMPNYTDLSALHRFGIPGVDFAFIDGESGYHSPLDTVDRLSPGALQSQGDNALAMLRGLGSADLRNPPRGYASWFDVLGLTVVRVPRGSVFPTVLALWVLTLGVGVVTRRRRRTRPWKIAASAGLALLSIALAAPLAWALCWVLGAVSGEAQPWVAHPWPLSIALVLLALAAQVALAQRAALTELELVLGGLVLQTTLALPLALFAPGAAYLFAAPLIVFVVLVAGALALTRGRAEPMAKVGPWLVLAAGFVALILWLPLMHALRLALGVGPHLTVCASFTGLWMWSTYKGAKPHVAPLLVGLATLGALLTLVLGPYSADAPRRQWLTQVSHAGEVRVLRAPGEIVDARLRISGQDVTAEVGSDVEWVVQSAESPVLNEVRVSPDTLDDRQRVSMKIQSRRGAPTIVLSVPAAAQLHELHIGDTGMPRGYIKDGDTRVEIHNVPPEGVHVEALLGDPSAIWRVADRTWWTDPPEDLRSPDAHASWDGDTTWVIRDLAPVSANANKARSR